MYVSVHVCMYVCVSLTLSLYLCVYLCAKEQPPGVLVVFVRERERVSMCVCVFERLCIHTCMHVSVCVYICIRFATSLTLGERKNMGWLRFVGSLKL